MYYVTQDVFLQYRNQSNVVSGTPTRISHMIISHILLLVKDFFSSQVTTSVAPLVEEADILLADSWS
jgi:hypothetical protein